MVHPAELGAITLDTMIITIVEEAMEEIGTTTLEGMTEDEMIGRTTEGEITEAEMIEEEEKEGMKRTERLPNPEGTEKE